MVNKTENNILASIKKRLSLHMEPVIGYTRMVSATKFIFSFLAVILILLLIILPLLNPVKNNFRVSFSSVKASDQNLSPKMLNPRFQGADKDDQLYNITADDAVKDTDDNITLNNVNADMTLKDGTWLTLISDRGLFNSKRKTMDINGAVNISVHEGYEFRTDGIHIDIEDNSAYTTAPVTGKGPSGSISAKHLIVEDSGNKAIFKGKVKVTLYPGKT